VAVLGESHLVKEEFQGSKVSLTSRVFLAGVVDTHAGRGGSSVGRRFIPGMIQISEWGRGKAPPHTRPLSPQRVI